MLTRKKSRPKTKIKKIYKRNHKFSRKKRGGTKHISLTDSSIDDYIIGVNYEAGKVIDNIRHLPNCLGYANCQISMDAPFSGRVADESVRSTARSESLFEDYNEEALKSNFKEIMRLIKTEYLDKSPKPKLVIQMARGRASISTINDIILPILDEFGIKKFDIVTGYRSTDYYTGCDNRPFVFLNYGMFGVLTNDDKIHVGEICNPILSYSITGTKGNLLLLNEGSSFMDDPKNILNNPSITSLNIKKIILFGIEDNMPFITPDEYNKSDFDILIDKIK